jgi:hypothetical protein
VRKGERTLFWIALPPEVRQANKANNNTNNNDDDDDDDNDNDDNGGSGGSTLLLKRDAETPFVPAGHVSLARVDDPGAGIDPDPTLAAPDGSILAITSLFILPVFRGREYRLGQFAMRECERLARQVPYGCANCRCLTVWTLSARYAAGGEEGWDGLGRWERLRMSVPQRANGPWFESLGYVKYKEEIRLHFGLPDEPMAWYCTFLRKELPVGECGFREEIGFTECYYQKARSHERSTSIGSKQLAFDDNL